MVFTLQLTTLSIDDVHGDIHFDPPPHQSARRKENKTEKKKEVSGTKSKKKTKDKEKQNLDNR